MIDRIARSLWDNDVLKGSATALAIKCTASVLGFTMFALSSRQMEPEEFGALAIIFNAMSFLAAASLCGQETLIVRSWAEYCGSDRPALARGALTFGAQVTVGAATLMTMVVALAWSLWDRSASLPLMLAACAFLFCHALLQFSGQFSRVAAGLIIGEGPRELLWRLIVVLAIGAHHVMNIAFGATEFFVAAAGALTFAIAVQAVQVVRLIPDAVRQAKPERDIRAWVPRSFKMWLSALMDTTSQYLEVVAVGLVLGTKAAGFYFVATRITNVFAMITGSISVYATPQISALFYSDAKHELQRILRLLAVIGAILVGSTLLLIVVAGKLLLWMFGTAYMSIYPALIVLAAGASIGALVGPAAHVLLLTGHEGAYPRIMASGLLIRFLMIVVLGHMFGLIGAVVATAVSTVAIAFALILACRRLVGLDPSLSFALMRLREQPAKS
jgi:O-antigen/teichoic acid export membrane protein